MFGAIAGGIASALAGGAMSKFFGDGQKAASGGIQGEVLATDNNTVGMGGAGIESAIYGFNVPNPDEAVALGGRVRRQRVRRQGRPGPRETADGGLGRAEPRRVAGLLQRRLPRSAA